MISVNAWSNLLILRQDSANIIYQTPRPAVLWPNKPGMFIVDIYNNCIKLSAVSGCSLIFSASVITEEPCYPSYYRTSYYRAILRTIVPRTIVRSYLVLSFVHTFIHCKPYVCFSREVSRRLCDYLFE